MGKGTVYQTQAQWKGFVYDEGTVFFPAVKTPASLFSPGPVDVELLLFKVELSLAKY